MKPAQKPNVLDRRRAAQGLRPPVVELDAAPRPADAAGMEFPLAAAAVAEPDGALHLGREGGRLRGPALLARLLDEPLPLRVLAEEEVETGLEELLGAGGRVRVGECVPRRVELVEEASGDVEVEPPEVGTERFDADDPCAR